MVVVARLCVRAPVWNWAPVIATKPVNIIATSIMVRTRFTWSPPRRHHGPAVIVMVAGAYPVSLCIERYTFLLDSASFYQILTPLYRSQSSVNADGARSGNLSHHPSEPVSEHTLAMMQELLGAARRA